MKYYGKYRALVSDNADPLKLGRLKLVIPEIFGSKAVSLWALPCVPYAGPNEGALMIPPVKACVWVEFEGGDPGRPVWVGCFWASPTSVQKYADSTGPETPSAALSTYPAAKVLKTGKFTVKFDDSAQKATLSCPNATFEVDAAGAVTVTAAAGLTLSSLTADLNGQAPLALGAALIALKAQLDALAAAVAASVSGHTHTIDTPTGVTTATAAAAIPAPPALPGQLQTVKTRAG